MEGRFYKAVTLLDSPMPTTVLGMEETSDTHVLNVNLFKSPKAGP